MADDDDDDGSRRPPQAYATVSPAGVGTTTTNQVSPGTIQEILDTGEQNLIDQAFDQMGVDDLTAYLESLPPPSVPAGVGSQASRTLRPTGLEHPIAGVLGYHRARFEPLPFGRARDCWPPPELVVVVVVVVVEVMEVVEVDGVPHVEDRDEDEDDHDHDALNPLPPCLGLPQSLTTSNTP